MIEFETILPMRPQLHPRTQLALLCQNTSLGFVEMLKQLSLPKSLPTIVSNR